MHLDLRNILDPSECPRLRKVKWVGPFPETDRTAWLRAARGIGKPGRVFGRPLVTDPTSRMVALWINRSIPIRWAVLVGAAVWVSRGTTRIALGRHIQGALRLSAWWRRHPEDMPGKLPVHRYGAMDGPRKQKGHSLWRTWMVRRVALMFAQSLSMELHRQHPALWWRPYVDYFNGVVQLPQSPMDAPPDLRLVLRNGILPPTCQNEVKLAASIRKAIRCSQRFHTDLIGPTVHRAREHWWQFDKIARMRDAQLGGGVQDAGHREAGESSPGQP